MGFCSRKSSLLHRVIGSWDVIARGLNEDAVTLVDVLIAKAWMEGCSLPFAEASKVCGLDVEAERFSAMHVSFKRMRQLRKQRNDSVAQNEEDVLFFRKSGMLHQMALTSLGSYVQDPIVLTDEDFKPGRMVDHSFVGRVMAASAWSLWLLIVLPVWAYRYRRGRIIRSVSERLTLLLSRSDWLWLMGGGVLFPFCYYWVIQLWSPFSARAEGIYYSTFIQMAGQFTSMLLMFFVFSLLILRWRLSRWGGIFVVRTNKWVWMMVVFSMLIPLVLGAATWGSSINMPMLYFAGGMGSVVGLWILWVGARAIDSLTRAVSCRLLLPVYALAILLMAASVAINYQQEQYWTQKDWIFELSEEEPGFGRYEYRLSVQLNKELAVILNASK